jgi:hypothetical protein
MLKSSILSLGALLCVTAAFSQQPNPAAVAGLPPSKGVYYNSTSGWAALPWNLLWPYPHSVWKSYFNVGHLTYDAEMTGVHSGFQIADARPVFYVRDMDTPQLIQVGTKRDFRTVRMQNAGLFEPRAPFPQHSVIDVDIAATAADGVLSVRPRAPLAPGEYMIAGSGIQDQRSLMLSFDFRVVGGTPK